MNRAFAAWKDKPLLSITKDKVAKLHTSLGETQGEAYANLAMRLLRALFNFAARLRKPMQLITENLLKLMNNVP